MGFFSRPKPEPAKSEPVESAASPQPAPDDQPAPSLVVVDVMPKPEILDPQGKAVSASLVRLGFDGLSVRQGKRFEITVEGPITDERLDQIRQASEKLLANTVIEKFDVRVES